MCVSFVHAGVKGAAVRGQDLPSKEDGKSQAGIFFFPPHKFAFPNLHFYIDIMRCILK